MKYIAGFLLSGIFLIPGSCSLFLIAGIQYTHYTMEKKLECSQLQTIEVGKDAITWLRKEKEVIIGGKPFDVKSVHHKDENTLVIKGMYDENEKKLLDMIRKQEAGSREKSISFAFLLLIIPVAGKTESCETNHPLISNMKPLAGNSGSLPDPVCSVNTPPPDGC